MIVGLDDISCLFRPLSGEPVLKEPDHRCVVVFHSDVDDECTVAGKRRDRSILSAVSS
jgi:hypothetical protein